jgi:hypothetical protein
MVFLVLSNFVYPLCALICLMLLAYDALNNQWIITLGNIVGIMTGFLPVIMFLNNFKNTHIIAFTILCISVLVVNYLFFAKKKFILFKILYTYPETIRTFS